MLPKVIFLGPEKTETMFMIFFDTKRRYIDIFGFDGGNPDFYLHFFGDILCSFTGLYIYKMS